MNIDQAIKKTKTSKVLHRSLPGERFTPYSLAKKLGAKALLESSSLQKGKERYSILLVEPAFSILQRGEEQFFQSSEGRRRIKHGGRDILDTLRHFSEQHGGYSDEIPLPAGGIGFLSYEYATHFDRIRLEDRPGIEEVPDAAFLFGHIYLVFDHYSDKIHLLGLNYRERSIDLEQTMDRLEQRLNDRDFNYLVEGPRKYHSVLQTKPGEQEHFLRGVEKLKKEIAAGNLLQGVLSRRLYIRSDIPAIEAYRELRSANPSPYLFYLDFGSFQLFGSSPEVHVKLKNGRAEIHPIAGTRRRGADAEEDRRLAEELANDQKERSEHLMLVDLARNDLGRFCRPGSVRVDKFMEVENYSHVMHLVSVVGGTPEETASGVEAIRRTFPAGTVSGAPKIRAMEIINSIEPERRSFYAGLVGYLASDRSVDTCIAIRSALKIGDTLVLQAGAGIVYDSQPLRELEETNEKLRALAGAVGVEV
ncbi:MAG TPA: anthranilate synthase component I [Sediminispirochaeta sp.]|nr:anthranilate synthase component I [Sediminispirochaeta sp.]